MKYRHTKQIALLVAVILAAVASRFSGSINPYYLQVILFIGINVTIDPVSTFSETSCSALMEP